MKEVSLNLESEKYLDAQTVAEAAPEAVSKKPKLEVLEGGKRDWSKLYQDKQKKAGGFHSQLTGKYKRGRWDKQDPLYQVWSLAKRQVQQIEEIQKQEEIIKSNQEILKRAEESQARRLENPKLIKAKTHDEKMAEILMQQEERIKEETDRQSQTAREKLAIAEELRLTLIQAFDETAIEAGRLEKEIQTPPEITPRLKQTALKEEAEAEQKTAYEQWQKLERIAKALAKESVKAEKEFANAKKNFEDGKKVYGGLLARLLKGKKGRAEFEEFRKQFEEVETNLKELKLKYQEASEAADKAFEGIRPSDVEPPSLEKHRRDYVSRPTRSLPRQI